MEFQIGDKVRVRRDGVDKVNAGRTGEVTAVFEGAPFAVEVKFGPFGHLSFGLHELEKI